MNTENLSPELKAKRLIGGTAYAFTAEISSLYTAYNKQFPIRSGPD